GGILGLGLFLAMIVRCFKIVGRIIRNTIVPVHPKLAWAFGVCVACHGFAMISISYFDQIQVFWFWLLAVFGTLVASLERKVPSRQRSESPGLAAARVRSLAVPPSN